MELIQNYFATWDSIDTEEKYYDVVGDLPIQNFIYYVKIRDKGFKFIKLPSTNA